MNTNSKKSQLIGIGAILLLVLGVLIGRWSGNDTGERHHHVVAAQHAESNKEAVWTCSMHPQVRQPAPGSCPLCGMDLIPAASEAGNDHAGDLPKLVLSDRAAALIDVRTWPVERRRVGREVRLPGKIDFDERRLAAITARFPGRLDTLYVNFTGSHVERGDPIAEIYSPALISAQEEFLQARRVEESDNAILNAARDRLLLLGLSDEQIAAIEQRGETIDRMTIFSPISGIVTQRLVSEGSYVDTGQVMFSVVDPAALWVSLEAYEADLIWLSVGQSVTFSASARPGEQWDGTIVFIDPVVNESSRTARVRVDLEEPKQWLKPGMLVRGSVHSSFGDAMDEPPLVIPAAAPLITGERSIVYVKTTGADAQSFEAREVVLGPKAASDYVVVDGLDEGEIVVVRGAFQIDSELQIRGRPSMMAPAQPEVITESIHEVTALASADAVPAAFGRQINHLTQAYLDLTAALAADALQEAQTAVESIRNRLGEIDATLLDENTQAAWVSLHHDLHSILRDLVKAEGLPEIREQLQPLTYAIETAIFSFHGGEVATFYKAYCPMAFDDRGGTWLQRGPRVENAYFGAVMHRCGDIISHPKQGVTVEP